MAVRVRRRRSSASPVLLVPSLLGLALIAAAAWAYSTDRIRFGAPATASERKPSRSGVREGYVTVPMTAMEIPAYTKIRREHYWNPQENRYLYAEIPASQVTPDTVTFEKIRGDFGLLNRRVLARSKGKGYAFRWSDFLPEGTRPGLSGGIPEGKRGLWVSTEQVPGLEDLKAGDRFDILATVELETNARRRSPGIVNGALAAQLAARDARRREQPRANVDVLVQAGVVVEPVRPRRGQDTGPQRAARANPVLEAFVAVDTDEVAPLVRALGLDNTIQVIVRSGRPSDDPLLDQTPGLADDTDADLERPVRHGFVETLAAGRRTAVPVPLQPRPQEPAPVAGNRAGGGGGFVEATSSRAEAGSKDDRGGR